MRSPRTAIPLLSTLVLAACSSPMDVVATASSASAASTPAGSWRAEYLRDQLKGARARHQFTSHAGEDIACVDFFEQPSMQRPEVRADAPASPPTEHPYVSPDAHPAPLESEAYASTVDASGNVRHCPDGTVPIVRVSEKVLSNFSSLRDFYRKGSVAHGTHPAFAPLVDPGTYWHGVEYQTNITAYGVQATLSSWRPTTNDKDHSISQLWVINDTASTNTVEFGWAVKPAFFKDYDAHLFGYWTNDSYKTGCYNTSCPGFVQYSGTIHLGDKLTSYSSVNGAQYSNTFVIQRNSAGDWWLGYGGAWIGYYPHTLYTTLGWGAVEVDWGGEVYGGGTGTSTTTDMGSGQWSGTGYGKAAFQSHVQYIDARNALIDPPSPSDDGVENPFCYDIHPVYGQSPLIGRSLYFGGPGSNPYCR